MMMDPNAKAAPADLVTDGGAAGENGSLNPEEREQQEKEWRDELAKTEEEVNTLKQVLASKQRRVNELKKNLGINIVTEVKDGLKHLTDSEMMQKTSQALKTAGERTSAAFSNVGKKLGDVKSSQLYKSFEEKVGSAYENVKAKVSGSKSEATTPVDPPATNDDDQVS